MKGHKHGLSDKIVHNIIGHKCGKKKYKKEKEKEDEEEDED